MGSQVRSVVVVVVVVGGFFCVPLLLLGIKWEKETASV